MLNVDHIHKQFASTVAVDDLSFDVRQGEVVALLGPNGAGKTTTVRMLIGMQRPDRGTVTFTDSQGVERATLPAPALGYLPEERGLYIDCKVLQMLRYFGQLRGMSKRDADENALKWLEYFELSERQNDEIKTLSKGNQQKVQIISAILHRPEFAILDEPFSGFDPINQEKVIRLITDLKKQGTTVLLSAHQMELVERLADRIILLDHGRIVLQGTMAQIREQAAYARQIIVEFEQPVSDENLQVLASNGLQMKGDGDRTVTIFFSELNGMNDVLNGLTGLGKIDRLTSREVNLHDIYLNSLSEARV